MADVKDYLQLLPEGWQRDLDAYEDKAKSLVALVVKSNREVKALSGSPVNGASYTEVEALVKKLNAAYAQLEITTDKLTKAQAALDAARVRSKQQIDALTTSTEKSKKAKEDEAAASQKTAQQLAAEKVSRQEANKTLIEEARAQNASYRARQDAIALAKMQKTEERALAQERKEYANWWKRALKEQEAAERNAAKAGKEHELAQRNALKAEMQEQKALQDLNNEYKQLSIAYNDAALKSKNYALRLGESHPITIQAQAEALKMGETLKRLDSAVGQNGRNVGNYADGYGKFISILRNSGQPITAVARIFGISADTVDSFRITIEHALQTLQAFTQKKGEASGGGTGDASAQAEAMAAAVEQEVVATQESIAANAEATVAQQANTVAKETNIVATEASVVATETGVVATEAATVANVELTTATTATTVATTGSTIAMRLFKAALLATGIGALVIVLTAVIGKLKEMADEMHQAEAAKKTLDEAFKDPSVKTAIENVSTLKAEIALAKQGILDKAKVLHHYNDTIGQTTGEVKSLDAAEKTLVNNGEAYVKMMLYKAAANIAMQEAAQKALEAEKIRLKELRDFSSVTDAMSSGAATYSRNEFEDPNKIIERSQAAQKDAARRRQERKDAAQKEADKALKDQEDIASAFTKKAAEQAKKFNFDYFGGTQDEKVKKQKKEKQSYQPKDYTQEIATEAAKQQAIEAEKNKRIFQDEDETTLKRVMALRAYYDQMQAASDARLNGELSETQNTLAKIDAIRQKDGSKLTDSERDLLGQRALMEARLTRIITEQSNERLKIHTEATNEEEKVTKKFYTGYEAALRSVKSYLDDLDQKTKDADQKRKDAAAAEREELEKRIEIARKFQDIANELAQFSGIATQKRLAELDQESEAIQQRYDREVNGVQNSLLSEEDKAKKIGALREQQFQEEQVIEARRKEERIKQAQFEKDMALANILINTAIAASKVLDNPFELALVIAVGAAQFAVAANTPIPQYAEGIFGDKSHPGGKAIVGDGGKSEYVVYPSGRIGITPAVPTLVDLPRGTMVMPDLDSFLMRYPTHELAAHGTYPIPESNKPMEKLLQRNNALLGRILQKPPVTIRESRRDMHFPFRRNR